ncbi:MAG TPA: hypothetical protein EYN96_03840 [Candidatus Hydrogenedentes bacterium]|nr:hypothetical protein [Candidatus Hydrogenedentota bacterium]
MPVRIFLFCVVTLMVWLPASAQKQPADEKAFLEVQANNEVFLGDLGLDEQELYDLIQSFMLIRLKTTLDLTDVQTLNLMGKIGVYEEQLPRLKFHKALLISQLRIQLAESSSDALIQESVTALLENDQKTVETLRSMITDAGDELGAGQRANLYLFVGDFEQDIRRMAMHAQRMNQAGHQRYTKELHDRYHEMTDDDSSALRMMIEERTSGLDINDPDEKNIIELVDAWLMVRLSSELKLTTEETVQLFKRVGTHKDQLQEMKWQMGAARLELRIAARDGFDTDIIEEQLENMLLREEAVADLIKSFVTEAQKDLSTHRTAQLFLFLGDFEQEVVDLIERSIMRTTE